MDRSQTHQQDPEMENDKLKNEKRNNDSESGNVCSADH
jgi:hypothetical protein